MIFWGIGKQCISNLERHPAYVPDGFIDTNHYGIEYMNTIVLNPKEIHDWKSYFFVITVAYKEISGFLEEKGLKENVDFCDIPTFYAWDIRTPKQCVSDFGSFMDSNPRYIGGLLIWGALVGKRLTSTLDFYKKYMQNEPKIFITRLFGRSDISNYLASPVFELCGQVGWDWQNSYDYFKNTGLDLEKEYYFNLNPQIKSWVDSLYKKDFDIRKLRSIVSTVYISYENIIKRMMPRKVIMWGGWELECVVLEKICQDNYIPFEYQEFGAIPGTVSIDSKGLLGKSNAYNNPDVISNMNYTENEIRAVDRLISDITTNKTDSMCFDHCTMDYEMRKLDTNRKTILLCGMCDYIIDKRMDPYFWDNYVSEIVKSSIEAAKILERISEINHFNLIFKPHPYMLDYRPDMRRELSDKTIFVAKMSTDTLFEFTDVVVSITSKVDYRALFYKKPLVILGKSILCNRDIVYEPKCIEDIEAVIKKALITGYTENNERNFKILVAKMLKTVLLDDMSSKPVPCGIVL